MRNQLWQVKKILSIYRDRGEAVLQALIAKEYEAADELLKKRDAAFYNLRVAINDAELEGLDLQSDQEIVEMASEAGICDSEIAVLIKEQQKGLLEEIKTFNHSRRHLTKYQSGRPQASGFEKSA